MSGKICAACQQIITENSVSGADHTSYHPLCFNCDFCKENLNNKLFFERDGKKYCQLDYAILHGNRCVECEKIILGKANIVKNKYYHPECFVCFDCKKPIENNKVLLGNIKFRGEECEKIFCEEHHSKRFAKVCSACNKSTISYIVIGNKILHVDCLKCSECHNKIPLTSKMGIRDGEILCEKCASMN